MKKKLSLLLSVFLLTASVSLAQAEDQPDESIQDACGDSIVQLASNGDFDGVNACLSLEGSSAYNDVALIYAAWGNHPDIVSLLIDSGADVHVSSDQPLISAAEMGYLDIVLMLLDAGADVNADEGDALMMASIHGHTEVVRVLLNAGAFVESDDIFGCMALDGARSRGHHEIVVMLESSIASQSDAQSIDDFEDEDYADEL